MIRIKKGLDIPIYGSPAGDIIDSKKSRSVAILGGDYIGMKPTMLVEEGDIVKIEFDVYQLTLAANMTKNCSSVQFIFCLKQSLFVLVFQLGIAVIICYDVRHFDHF